MFLQIHRKKVDIGKLVVLIWNNKSNVSCSRKSPTLLRFVNLLVLRKKRLVISRQTAEMLCFPPAP